MLPQEIFEVMEALGFKSSQRNGAIFFMPDDQFTAYVRFFNQHFEALHYNDDPEIESFQTLVRIEQKTVPTLTEWLMMLHIGRIATLSDFIRLHQFETGIIQDANDMMQDVANLQKLLAA